MDNTSRFFLCLMIVFLPVGLTQLVKTESCTIYAWWENIIGCGVVLMLYAGWIFLWYKILMAPILANKKIIASIRQRILDEQRKHKNLDWAKIAARKIYSTHVAK